MQPSIETITQKVIRQPRLTMNPKSSLLSTIDDESLKSTWTHRAWVAIGCTNVLVSLANSVVGSIYSSSTTLWVESILAGLLGYLIADLGTGVYHWAIDNYGNASTPIFGSQITEFQGHHKSPLSITKREFANNLYLLALSITFTVMPINITWYDRPVVMGFVGVASGCVMFSQQFHAWTHETKTKLPPMVVTLQDAGVILPRSKHAAHHKQPFNNNYCIVSGMWNRVLDDCKVFEALEKSVFFMLGVRPRSWSE